MEMEKVKNICVKVNYIAGCVLAMCLILIFGCVITQQKYYDLPNAVMVTLPFALIYGATLLVTNLIQEGQSMEWDEGEESE